MALYSDTKLSFGKYKDKFVYEVAKTDIKYLYWLVSVYEGIVTKSVTILLEKDKSQPIIFKEKSEYKKIKKVQNTFISLSPQEIERLEAEKIEKRKNEYMKSYPYSGVYLFSSIHNNELFYKIGKSQDVRSRYRGSKTTNIFLECEGFIPYWNIGELETTLHKHFEKYHYKLEWFYGNVEILNYFLFHTDFKLLK